jgi:hypothetical protein
VEQEVDTAAWPSTLSGDGPDGVFFLGSKTDLVAKGRENVEEPLTTTSTALATGSAGNGHAKLFISYSRKDRSFVERLPEALKASGQDIWVDLQDIRPSEDWLNAIHSAIEGADAFVFVVSPD